MRKWRHGRQMLGIVLCIVFASVACNKEKKDPADQAAANNGGPGGPGGPGGWPGGGPGGRPQSPIGKVMSKIGKGPQSLNSVIGQELKADAPEWDKIQPQAKEYAQLAAELSGYEPAKGSKDSWNQQTSSFANAAKDLDKAAAKKDLAAAKSAHTTLSQSCKACHDEHRGRPGGGMGRPGGPPRGN